MAEPITIAGLQYVMPGLSWAPWMLWSWQGGSLGWPPHTPGLRVAETRWHSQAGGAYLPGYLPPSPFTGKETTAETGEQPRVPSVQSSAEQGEREGHGLSQPHGLPTHQL